MRYFFLAYALLTVFVIGWFGVRGQKFSHTPFELFPDMDRQDKVKAQKPSLFFADGVGSRLPVDNTVASHLAEEKAPGEGLADIEFGVGRTGYYYTGKFGEETYGTGMPTELELTESNVGAFLRRGEERYQISCMPCHGENGNGQGIAVKLGVPNAANFHDAQWYSDKYPDGQLYHVITHGKGQMYGYGYNIPVRDRWAIVAYVRAMQKASKLTEAEKESILSAKAN